MRRDELDQHVEADVALDAEAARRRVQRGAGAELHGVGGDREVRLADQLRVVAVGEGDGDPRQGGEAGRGGEARVETADGEGEAADAGGAAERRRAGEREAAAQLGVDEHGVEGGGAGAEVEHADGVEVELNAAHLLGREHGAEPAEHDQPGRHGIAELEDEGEVEADELGARRTSA